MIAAIFSQLAFLQPLTLMGLLALPALWYILRVTPPAPKTVFFPATRFLTGLVSDEQTPSKSPWWLLLLRLLMVALMIIALARPVINQSDSIAGNTSVRIVIDNSWAAAQTWQTQISVAEQTIKSAAREKREIYILPTTANLGEDKPEHLGPFTQSTALSVLRGLKPNPWPADYKLIQNVLNNIKNNAYIYSIWLSHGLDEGGLLTAVKKLQSIGGVEYHRPKAENLPLLLRPSGTLSRKEEESLKGAPRIDVDATPDISENLPVTVQALTQGSILDIQTAIISASDVPKTISFDISENLRSNITQFKISARQGAGGIFLIDDQYKKRNVGIASSAQTENTAPLIEASYYIKRALEPFANITIDAPMTLIESKAAVIILPDIAAMPTDTLNALEDWVKEGGLLLRFSGPNMADSGADQFLTPVVLRSGGRSLDGSLSWDEAQTIAPFDEASPFYGLSIPDDISITRQLLTDPAQDLEGKVWATLTDGTPFITAAPKDKGMIILVHSTANTSWSNFALSGLYVSTLKRIMQFAGQTSSVGARSYSTLDPLLIMDGFGALMPPPAAVKPVQAAEVSGLTPNAHTPPGLYGNGQTQFALNIGTNLPKLKTAPTMPIGVRDNTYNTEHEVDLMPYLLLAALLLFILDWLVMVFVAGKGMAFKRPSFAALLMLLMLMPSVANASDDWDIRHAKGFYLAYIESGDLTTDSTTRQGLESLSQTLTQRTSIEPDGVAALNPETDTLAFFPLIYWAISPNQRTFSDKALQNIQSYLDQGGTILFDTRDQNNSTSATRNTDNAAALRSITASLNIPPITPIPDDHVLGRAFYLLEKYTGRYTEGTLWVEQNSASGRDNVSSVLIGSNDWAGSWAMSHNAKPNDRYANNYDGRQREMALRFGVNLVMYALTGNYKADQVHIPHILKRLDK